MKKTASNRNANPHSASSVASGDSDFEYIPHAFSSKSVSSSDRRQQSSVATNIVDTADANQSRRSRRSFADTLSFSELQAQQLAFEHLQAVAARKNVTRSVQQKAKSKAPARAVPASFWKPVVPVPAPKPVVSISSPKPVVSVPVPKPASTLFSRPVQQALKSVASAPRPVQPVGTKSIPTYYDSDTDSDFEPAPSKKPASRVKPVETPVKAAGLSSQTQKQLFARAYEKTATVVSETIDIFSGDDGDEDFDILRATYEVSSQISRKQSSQNGGGLTSKPKRKRPKSVAKKSDERKSSSFSKSHHASYKQAEPTVIVSDILSTRRDISNTVIHNTSWRQCYFDVAPVNLLPSSTGDARPCLMSKVYPPLTAYGTKLLLCLSPAAQGH